MQWDNIPKEERMAKWYVVAAPKRCDIYKAASWCRAHNSHGRFYNHYTNTRWWFDREEDALLFSLMWGG